jgi:hypothetical protein
MSVPDHQIVLYHVQSSGEDGHLPLGLPEVDAELVLFITDLMIAFLYFTHGPALRFAGHFTVIRRDSRDDQDLPNTAMPFSALYVDSSSNLLA